MRNYTTAMIRNPAFWRYTAFQIPGWIIATVGAFWLHESLDVPTSIAFAILAAWVIKDYLLFPFLRSAYEVDRRLPIELMIGQKGKAVNELAPSGYIRVRGELWKATLKPAQDHIGEGKPVEVTGLDGTTLIVSRSV